MFCKPRTSISCITINIRAYIRSKGTLQSLYKGCIFYIFKGEITLSFFQPLNMSSTLNIVILSTLKIQSGKKQLMTCSVAVQRSNLQPLNPISTLTFTLNTVSNGRIVYLERNMFQGWISFYQGYSIPCKLSHFSNVFQPWKYLWNYYIFQDFFQGLLKVLSLKMFKVFDAYTVGQLLVQSSTKVFNYY